MAWLQFAAVLVLMYLVVGTAGYWGLRKRREQQALHNSTQENQQH